MSGLMLNLTSRPVSVKPQNLKLRSVTAIKPISFAQKPLCCVKAKAVREPYPLLKDVNFHSDHWKTVRTEEQFFKVIAGLQKGGHISERLLLVWKDFYYNYKKAIASANLPTHTEELTTVIQATIADNVLHEFVHPYTFSSFHNRLMTPYNYFDFGQRYVASLIDFEKSYLGSFQRWENVADLLKQKHNVVMLANHQTEADPGVFAHLLGSVLPELGTGVIYVAGDRVITDPLCKPFSMGRNLFCVHSKKHMGDDPKLRALKLDTNRKTLFAMQKRLNEGGALIWIAPSGGRDRPNENGQYLPDSFDPSAVELMRNLISRAKRPGHLFPLAMFSYPMMPPPKTVDKAIGERRITNFTPIGMTLGEEIHWKQVISGVKGGKEAQHLALATAARTAVVEQYVELEKALRDPSARPKSYVQTWKMAAPATIAV